MVETEAYAVRPEPFVRGRRLVWSQVDPLTVGAGALALLLGLFRLGRPSLWVDESFTARATGYSYGSLVRQDHWLYYTLEKAWTSVAGTSEWALRFPSVVAFVAACVLLAHLGNRLFDRPVGGLAALCLAVNPFVVLWAQQARSYSMLVALVIGCTLLLVRALEQGGASNWIEYGALLLLLFVWQGLSGVLVLAVHLLVGWRTRAMGRTAIVAGTLALPWFLILSARESNGGPTTWLKAPDGQALLTTATELTGWFAFGLVALIGLWCMRGHRFARLVALWALLPFALTVAATPAVHIFLDRYLIVSAPAFALASGYAFSKVAPARTRVLAVAVALAVTALPLVASYSRSAGDNWRGEDWRDATVFVMRHGGGQVKPDWATSAFRYYGGRPAPGRWIIVWTENGGARGIPFGSSLRVVRH